MIVEFTSDARRDLLGIDDYIAADDPAEAARFVDELIARCRSLADFPDRCPVAMHRRHRTVRKMPHGNYIVFYAVQSATVEIVRILHARQNWRSIL